MTFSRLVALAVETVADTRKKLPRDIQDAARGVPVLCETAPDPSLQAEGLEPDILGLFTGPSHGTELEQDNPQPPQIILYINNLWDYAEEDTDLFQEEVRLTYLHELGHYLGWDEGQVAARGLE